MLLFFPLLSTRLRPPASPGGSGRSEGPRALSTEVNNVAFGRSRKTSNCKPGLLSLSGYAADAGWPPRTKHTVLCSHLRKHVSSADTWTHTLTKHKRTGCAVASCHQRVQTMCPHHPLASARDSFRDQRMSLRMSDRQNGPSRQQ